MPLVQGWGDPIGLFGQTKKQKEMSKATHPDGLNRPNEFAGSYEEQKQKQETPKVKEMTGVRAPNPIKQQGQQQQDQDVTSVTRSLMKNLGTFGLAVQSQVNRFLNQGQGVVGSTGGASVVWDDIKKSWTIADTVQSDTEQLALNKQQEQKQISDVLDEWYKGETGQRQAMSFKEGLDREYQRIANYYPDLRKKHEYLLGLADRLALLEDQGLGSSAEARSIRQSIALEDNQGLVRELWDARSKYKEVVYGEKGKGLTWSGDGFEEFSALDLEALDKATLKEQLKNAMVGQSGLFAGDFAVNLKRQLDEMTEEYKKSSQEELKRQQDFQKFAQEYLDDWSKKMARERAAIQKDFSDAVIQLEEKLNQLSGMDTGSIETAGSRYAPNGIDLYAWRTATRNVGRNAEKGELAKAYLAALGDGDFKEGMMKMLNDPNSGLQVRQRAIFREFLGHDQKEQREGQYAQWMSQLANGQPLEYKGRKVQLSADDKENLIRAVYTNDQKAIEEIFENNMRRINVDLDGLLEQSKKSPNLKNALEAWKTSITDSMKTFVYSKTEDAVKKAIGVSDEEWFNMNTAEKAAAILNYARSNGYSQFLSGVEGAAKQMNEELKKQIEEKSRLLEEEERRAREYIKQQEALKAEAEAKYAEAMARDTGNVKQAFTIDPSWDAKNYEHLVNGTEIGKMMKQGTVKEENVRLAAQAYSVANQVQQLAQNPLTQGLASSVSQNIQSQLGSSKYDPKAMTLKLNVTDFLNPEKAKAVINSWNNVSNNAKSAFERGDYDSIGMSALSRSLNAAASAKDNLMNNLNSAISEANARIGEIGRQKELIARMQKEYEQGVYSPGQIVQLGIEEAKALEYAALGTIKNVVRSYDLGGREGRQTYEELTRDSATIERKALKESVKAEDVGRMIQGAAPATPAVSLEYKVRPEVDAPKRPVEQPVPQSTQPVKDNTRIPFVVDEDIADYYELLRRGYDPHEAKWKAEMSERDLRRQLDRADIIKSKSGVYYIPDNKKNEKWLVDWINSQREKELKERELASSKNREDYRSRRNEWEEL